MMTAAVQKIAVGGFARLVPTEVHLTEPVEIPALCIVPDSECRSLVFTHISSIFLPAALFADNNALENLPQSLCLHI